MDANVEIPALFRVKEHFREQILSHRLLSGDRLPSTRDAARRLNVHHLTVTEAYRRLASDGLVELRSRVGAFVAGRGAGGEVLLCMREWEGAETHPAAVAGAILRRGAIRGLAISLMTVKNAEEMLLPTLKARLEKGFLRGAWLGSIPPAVARAAAELLSRHGAPVVHLSNIRLASHSVGADAAGSIRAGTRYLLGQGCRRLALIGFGIDIHPEREEAFRATCEALGARWQLAAMPFEDHGRLAGFERHGSQAVESLMRRKDPPDGLMIADDWMGRGALTALLRLRVRVPEDVRVCTLARKGSCYPDIFGMSVARLEQDDAQVAAAACEMMEHILAGDEVETRHLRLAPRLVAPEEAETACSPSGVGAPASE